MKHAVHSLIAYYEMEAQAAGILLSQARNALTEFGCEVGSGTAWQEQTRFAEDPCSGGRKPTWEEEVDGEIRRTEAHLRLCLDGRDSERLPVDTVLKG